MVSASPAMPSGAGGNVPQELISQVLQKLILVDKEGYFQMPVDEVLHHAPNYYIIIKNPMCFFDMKNRLAAGAYSNLRQLREDFDLICSNARTFNKNTTKVYKAAMNLHQKGSKILKQHEMDLKRVGRGGAIAIPHAAEAPHSEELAGMDFGQNGGAFPPAQPRHHRHHQHDNGFGGAAAGAMGALPHFGGDASAAGAHQAGLSGSYAWMTEDYPQQQLQGDGASLLSPPAATTGFFSQHQGAAAWPQAMLSQFSALPSAGIWSAPPQVRGEHKMIKKEHLHVSAW